VASNTAGTSIESATVRPARSAEGRETEAGRRLKRLGLLTAVVNAREDDPRVEGLNFDAAGGLGGAGRVAIIEIDPFKESFPGGWRDDRLAVRHDQPLVPTARRYSVT
jgi:hypothetical protein